jgi:UDP-2-acetamido-2,6-beta-L-arabino-hexul-4-ose reductase
VTTAVVTGAKGFIGRHLVRALRDEGFSVHEITRSSTTSETDAALAAADVVYHLAGANRPPDPSEFEWTNVGFTRRVVDGVTAGKKSPVVVLASSIQAERDNPYGKSKLAAETVVEGAAGRGLRARIYRLPNVFGRGCRPNYNSAVATFCHYAARGEPLPINNRESPVKLVYVDDVTDAFLRHARSETESAIEHPEVAPVFDSTVGELADHIQSFASSDRILRPQDFSDPLVAHLYATYLAYVPKDVPDE